MRVFESFCVAVGKLEPASLSATVGWSSLLRVSVGRRVGGQESKVRVIWLRLVN